MIHLALGRLLVDTGKNSFFTDHRALYQPSDCKNVPSYYEGIESVKGLGKPLVHVKDRIELLGYTIDTSKKLYELENDLFDEENITHQSIPFEVVSQALSEVHVRGVTGEYSEIRELGKFVDPDVVRKFYPDIRSDKSTFEQPDHWDIDILLSQFNVYTGLRLLAQNSDNLELEVYWDYGPLADAGWADSEYFISGVPRNQKYLIVTEGSSDAKIIQHALSLFRPHVSDFFEFVDMEEGYPFSGTGNLYRFAQGLVSIGIINNTLIVYDNDTEGIEKHKKTCELSLPSNMRSVVLPNQDDFKHFSTLGPNGISTEDINGKAASIECYLDHHQNGLPEANVRWTAFNSESNTYQGSLEHKEQYKKHFLKMRYPNSGYDSTKINAVLDYFIANCINMAEIRVFENLDEIAN